MTCQQCQCNWCWICGQVILGSVGWHYSARNQDSGCHQFAEPHGHPDPEKVKEARRVLAALKWKIFLPRLVMLLITGILVWTAVCLVLVVSPFALLFGVLILRRSFDDVFTGLGMVAACSLAPIMLVCLLAVQLVWTPFGITIWFFHRRHAGLWYPIVCVPCQTIEESLQE
uniref:Uncharacterized protein n=1 Tax=Alexandrium andersonii TaxID=327968 RepID=A0A7S2G6L3_9DINO|mmetsp:Transcript_43679/g.99141  ORF Transcript_43679/g.99141 Transcript_43679/m.99141 type:complete len:171 (+) Transcript_43679:3-515(+)